MKISDLQGTLFSPKELYLLCCSPKGKLPLLKEHSQHYRRKAEYDNLHLTEEIKYTSSGHPIVRGYNDTLDFEPIKYSSRKKVNGKGQFVHFHEHDYIWGNALWNNLELVLHSLSKFDGIFGPDYSLYCDYKNAWQFKLYNQLQVYKSRLISAIAQSLGFAVIPTVTIGDVDSFDYCFEGLPQHSVIALSGTGFESHAQRELLEYALRILVTKIHPTTILIYGPEFTPTGVNVDIRFHDDEITKFHRA